MPKAVLVMDMPEDCTMCKFWNSKDDECYATGVEELSLVLVGSGQEYLIYADSDTGVMYLYITISTGGGLTVMLNADGTPKIWQGEE